MIAETDHPHARTHTRTRACIFSDTRTFPQWAGGSEETDTHMVAVAGTDIVIRVHRE